MPETLAAAKERPILFSAPLVRAILDRRKTQTRRVIKPQPLTVAAGQPYGPKTVEVVDGNETRRISADPTTGNPFVKVIPCPYGAPGDRLYVREAFRLNAAHDDYSPARLYAKWQEEDRRITAANEAGTNVMGAFTKPPTVRYEADGALRLADGTAPDVDMMEDFPAMRGKLRPSIHMPRWASRIDLEITAVRVERVQEITHADAVAEGIPDDASARYTFSELWQKINGPRGFGWDADPWVWVVEFRTVDPA